MLQFLGRGSAFADEQNCAFFRAGSDLILIDCGMTAFHRLRHSAELLENVSCIRILVTHTHSDHIGGIPMLIHFAYYVLHIPVQVIAPDADVAADLLYLIDRMDGCEPSAYTVTTADAVAEPWLRGAIPTAHAPQLAGHCYGYHLCIGGKTVVFTGDSATLEPFLPLLKPGAVLYTEASYYQSNVHLHIDALLPVLKALKEQGVTVYLMHLDEEDAVIRAAAETGAQPAPLY